MKSEISHIEESDGTVVQVTKDLAHNDEIFILDINAVKAGELNVVGLKLDSDGHVSLSVERRFKVAFVYTHY